MRIYHLKRTRSIVIIIDIHPACAAPVDRRSAAGDDPGGFLTRGQWLRILALSGCGWWTIIEVIGWLLF